MSTDFFFFGTFFLLFVKRSCDNFSNIIFYPFLGEDDGFELSTEDHNLPGLVKYNMRKSLDLEQEGCYLQTGRKVCLEECGFNATAKTFFIIHGWTVRTGTEFCLV